MIRAAAQHASSPRSSYDSDEESSSEALIGNNTPRVPSNEAAWAVRSLRIVRLVALAGSFMFVGPMLILTNAYLLKTAHFPYPMALCAIAGKSKLYCGLHYFHRHDLTFMLEPSNGR